MELLFKGIKWLTTLQPQKMVIALFSILVSFLFYQNQQQKNDYRRLDNRYDLYRNTTDSLIHVCNEEKSREIRKVSEFYEKRVEKTEKKIQMLEERLYGKNEKIK